MPGVSPQSAEQETRALAARLHDTRPEGVVQHEYLGARPILQFDRASSEFQIALTAGALVAVLLLAGCANLGILVLARGVVRQAEIRTRLAVGASRARVTRQLLTESLLLATVSAACALLFSSAVLKAIQLRHNASITLPLFPGWPVLGATAAAAIVAAALFGLPTALRVTSLRPQGGR